jgi:hypothetical protein
MRFGWAHLIGFENVPVLYFCLENVGRGARGIAVDRPFKGCLKKFEVFVVIFGCFVVLKVVRTCLNPSFCKLINRWVKYVVPDTVYCFDAA